MNNLVHRLLLKDIIDRMSDEEKRNYAQMILAHQDHQEVMEALQQQGLQIEQIANRQDWRTSFLSDVGANFFTNGVMWLGAWLLRKM